MSFVLKFLRTFLILASWMASTDAFSATFDPDHLQIETDEKIWKKISDQEGVLTYQERYPEAGVVAFRGEVIMPTTLERIVTVLRDEGLRKEWVDALAEQKTLAEPSALEKIEYTHSKVPWPFQDRDFVYRAKVKVNLGPPRALSIVMTSMDSDLQPEKKGIVRGKILHSFYYMRELDGPEPRTQVLIEMAVDPMGEVPMWMVNLTQKRWPHNTLLALTKFSSRPDLIVPKEISDYFKPNVIPVVEKK